MLCLSQQTISLLITINFGAFVFLKNVSNRLCGLLDCLLGENVTKMRQLLLLSLLLEEEEEERGFLERTSTAQGGSTLSGN